MSVHFLIHYNFVCDGGLYEQVPKCIFKSSLSAGMCSVRVFSSLDDSVKYLPSHFASNHETRAKYPKCSQPKTEKLATLKINSTGSPIVFEGLEFFPTKES